MTELPEITEAKERVKQVVEIMILADSDLKRVIRKYLNKLTELSLEYADLGKEFTFDAREQLRVEIDTLFGLMQEELLNLINKRSLQASELIQENEDDIHPFMLLDYKGGNVSSRISNYLSNIRKELETYIAIGIVDKLNKDDIVNLYLSNLKHPYKSKEFIDAVNERGYKTERIKNKGVTFGVGKYISAFSGLKMLEQDTIYKAYNYSLQRSWILSGDVIGWYTVRGSNFPCPDICDPMVKVFHPINEPYYGYHARCVCPMIPVKK